MAELFHKTFATDLSEFNATGAANGTIAQSAGAGLNSTTGGVLCTATAASPNIFGSVTSSFSGKTSMRTAWYTDLSAMAIGTSTHSTRLYEFVSADSITNASLILLRNLSGVLNIQHYFISDSNVFNLNSVPLTGWPDWLELWVQRSGGLAVADGESRLYFGGGDYDATGELVSTHTGIVHYTRFEQDTHRVGIRSGSSSVGGALKFDEWTMRDDDEPILFGVSAEEVENVTRGGGGGAITSLSSYAHIG